MRYKRLLNYAEAIFAALAFFFATIIGATAQSETVLHSFAGSDGISPAMSLVFDSAGNLYGVTSQGGGSNNGAVFELTQGTGGTWTSKTIFSFNGGSEGSTPVGGLIFDSTGNLYGTTKLGGTKGSGVVYKLSASSGKWTQTVLHNFGVAKDGQYPLASLVLDGKGDLFGTTEGGGAYGNGTETAGGTAFELTPGSSGTWTEKVVHSFGHGTDGLSPHSNLVLDKIGNLYGTTIQGGANKYGTVFEITPSGSGFTEKILYSFNPSNFSDGALPTAGLIFDKAGNLYGTTVAGGEMAGGTAFELSPKGSGWTETVIYAFEYAFYDPASIHAGLIMDASGNLYGTTVRGTNAYVPGTFFDGTVYKLTPTSGGGMWAETTLFNFDGTHGSVPGLGSLVADASGNLYGTTQAGGTHKDGVVFKVTP